MYGPRGEAEPFGSACREGHLGLRAGEIAAHQRDQRQVDVRGRDRLVGHKLPHGGNVVVICLGADPPWPPRGGDGWQRTRHADTPRCHITFRSPGGTTVAPGGPISSAAIPRFASPHAGKSRLVECRPWLTTTRSKVSARCSVSSTGSQLAMRSPWPSTVAEIGGTRGEPRRRCAPCSTWTAAVS
jgi:hypothetical protein